jgi:cytochrome bd-type quinol oxidase subunit 2
MTAAVFIGEEPYVSMAHQRLAEIRAKFAQNPPPAGTEMSAFKSEIGDFPPEWQGLLLGCFVSGFDLGADVKNEKHNMFIRDTAYSAVGIVLIVAGAGMTFLRKDMTSEQSNASCAVIAVGIAAFLVFLPGFLKLNGVMKPTEAFESLTFKASGGIGIFVLTFVLLRVAFKF